MARACRHENEDPSCGWSGGVQCYETSSAEDDEHPADADEPERVAAVF